MHYFLVKECYNLLNFNVDMTKIDLNFMIILKFAIFIIIILLAIISPFQIDPLLLLSQILSLLGLVATSDIRYHSMS